MKISAVNDERRSDVGGGFLFFRPPVSWAPGASRPGHCPVFSILGCCLCPAAGRNGCTNRCAPESALGQEKQ